jgi:ABC-2 type transport system ATP-binding protein
MPGAVEVEHLHVVRGGRTVLDDVSLTVPEGRVTCLLGPSGCGKTTLIRSIVGVQRLAGGRLTVLGQPAGSPALRSRVGYMTQAPSIYPDLSIAENLRYFARLGAAAAGEVDAVLATVGLGAERDRVVRSLSGGQAARVNLATAMLHGPELLALDEPTVGLDPVLRRDLWRTFHQLAAQGTTLLVSSHVMDEAAEADELLLMREGALLAQTTPDRLRADTGEPDLGKAFLAVIERR